MENLRIEIFVPHVAHRVCLKSFYETLVREFGGFTVFKGLPNDDNPAIAGFWLNKHGKIESDIIDYILVFRRGNKDETADILEKEVIIVGKMLKQSCMLFVINNKSYFIPIKPKET